MTKKGKEKPRNKTQEKKTYPKQKQKVQGTNDKVVMDENVHQLLGTKS
jgi:hypothetical protein